MWKSLYFKREKDYFNPNYFSRFTNCFMSLFSILRKVSMRLRRNQRGFLWVGRALEKKKRGLGIKSLSLLSKVLLCKWSWRFASEKRAFGRQVIGSKYGEVKRRLVDL